MKYNLSAFNKAVYYYERLLRPHKGKTILLVFDVKNEKAFYSLAPLSRAAHNMKCDLSVRGVQERSKGVEMLLDVWNTYDLLARGIKSPETKALDDFIKEVDKKAKGEFRKIFRRPELFIQAAKHEFVASKGFTLDYHPEWFKKYKWDKLLKTGKTVWTQTFNLKKNEPVGIGFELIHKAADMKYPLEDYLDSYAIAKSMFDSCYAKRKTLKAATSRKTMVEKGERIGELAATLMGCELEKDINEPVFRKYRKLSKLLNLSRVEINRVVFYVVGEGSAGKHIFGDAIGYPTPNRKSRWTSPGGMVYQFPWAPQTKIDKRGPLSRVGFTDTLPLDIYIDSCMIDWMEMKRKDDALIKMVKASEKIVVESSKTRFEVGLVRPNGKRRKPMNSDVDTRTILDKEALKDGIKAGNMANIPGGEMFITPEFIKGTVYGDVVISIDKSYVLNSKKPLVVKCDERGYKIIDGPKDVVKKIDEKKKEAMKILLSQEKSKSLPANIVKMKKDNYNKIGEFAINTNPKARLCEYLIVNEKIAGMIHVALGSGFEEDRSSIYHYDIVINAKEQKLDIFGLKKGKKLWMMKKGKLQV